MVIFTNKQWKEKQTNFENEQKKAYILCKEAKIQEKVQRDRADKQDETINNLLKENEILIKWVKQILEIYGKEVDYEEENYVQIPYYKKKEDYYIDTEYNQSISKYEIEVPKISFISYGE